MKLGGVASKWILRILGRQASVTSDERRPSSAWLVFPLITVLADLDPTPLRRYHSLMLASAERMHPCASPLPNLTAISIRIPRVVLLENE